jgi:hypothetical protein
MTRLLLLLALAGCASPTIPEGTVRIQAPVEYVDWWEASRACIAKPEVRGFGDIEWYVTPEKPEDSDGVEGVAMTVDNRIYLWSPYIARAWVIQHELVHAINDIDGHPDDPFWRCNLMAEQHGGPI